MQHISGTLFIINKKHFYSSLHIYLDVTRIIYMQISSYDCKLKGSKLLMDFIKRFY